MVLFVEDASQLAINEQVYRWASLSQIKQMILLDNIVGPYVTDGDRAALTRSAGEQVGCRAGMMTGHFVHVIGDPGPFAHQAQAGLAAQ